MLGNSLAVLLIHGLVVTPHLVQQLMINLCPCVFEHRAKLQLHRNHMLITLMFARHLNDHMNT